VSGSATLAIVAGAPVKLSARKDSMSALGEAIASNVASSGASKKRVIAEDVIIVALDVAGNECLFPSELFVTCSLRLPESTATDREAPPSLCLPMLVGCDSYGSVAGTISSDGMSFVFPRLELVPTKGGGEGRIELCFRVASQTESTTADMQEWVASFYFTSDNARMARSSNLLSKLTALENKILEHEQRKSALEKDIDAIQKISPAPFNKEHQLKGY